MPKRKNNTLTPLQEETLRMICDFIDEHGYPPTVNNVGSHFGIRYSSAQDRVQYLSEKGYIECGGKARTIRVIRRPRGYEPQLISFPLVGTVAAGMPILAEENREGEVLIECKIPDPDNCFAVRAWGESMIDIGIRTGSILIVRQQFLASDGDIVVATVNGESTVKTLRYAQNKVILMPENKTMKPIPIKDTDDFRIQGVVLFWRSVG